MGAYRSAMIPPLGHITGMVSMTGISPHHMGLPVFPPHLLPVMPGMPFFGKNVVIDTSLATQLLPFHQSDSLEGLPVPIGWGPWVDDEAVESMYIASTGAWLFVLLFAAGSFVMCHRQNPIVSNEESKPAILNNIYLIWIKVLIISILDLNCKICNPNGHQMPFCTFSTVF